MKRYPTENGIAVAPAELWLPDSKDRRRNNHHLEFSKRAMGRLAVTRCLRDLERLQYVMPVDVHEWLHSTYQPPNMPSGEQAALEIIDAYDQGENFKRRLKGGYKLEPIPLELVDELICTYGLKKYLLTG